MNLTNNIEARGLLLQMPKRTPQDNLEELVAKKTIAACIPIEGQRNLERILLTDEQSRLGNLIYELETNMDSDEHSLKIKPWVKFLKMLKDSKGIGKEVLSVANKAVVPWNLSRVRGCDSKSLCEFLKIYNKWNKQETLKSKEADKTEVKPNLDLFSTFKSKIRGLLGMKRQQLVPLKTQYENN